MISFIDRKDELAILEKDWASSENVFEVIYGRRRNGKTRLITEFLKDKEGIKYTAQDNIKKVQISEFKKILEGVPNSLMGKEAAQYLLGDIKNSLQQKK